MNIERKITKKIIVGNIVIGAQKPVVIQSMTNTSTENITATLDQIKHLYDSGCSIARLAVPNSKAVTSFRKIKEKSPIPLVADIHFDYKLAIGAIEAGADKIRINPGNIGAKDKVKMVVDAAKQAQIPIRIGVNSGSLEKNLLQKFGAPTPEALVASAQEYIALMEKFNFDDIIFSIKATDVPTTIAACTLFAEVSDYPQHIGITESGTVRTGSIRSAVGIGAILARGIGDTIRVSLSGDPVKEIVVAKQILKSLSLINGPVVIACPTCGRTNINVAELATKVENMVSNIDKNISIAVMGCVVNGPGEAREADVGVAGGRGDGMIFRNGVEVEKVAESHLLERLWIHIQEILSARK